MPAAFSAYLDLVRFGAAFVVLLSHAWPGLTSQRNLPWPGHQAVAVFFVLSGFVVAFVSFTKETHIFDFAFRRAVRILSVTIPALALASAVALLTGHAWVDIAQGVWINLLFLGQSWSWDIMPVDNPPYWSLCYEVWYYAIFAAAIYPISSTTKVLGVIVFCLIAGPKILLLMPCWLCGVALYHFREKLSVSASIALALFAGSILLYGAFFWYDVSIQIREGLRAPYPTFVQNLNASNQFVGDFLLSLLVSMNFLGAYHIKGVIVRLLIRYKRIIARAASCTLSVYLYHFPVMIMLDHMGVRNWLGLFLTITVSVGLAPLTEWRRNQLRDVLNAGVLRARAAFMT